MNHYCLSANLAVYTNSLTACTVVALFNVGCSVFSWTEIQFWFPVISNDLLMSHFAVQCMHVPLQLEFPVKCCHYARRQTVMCITQSVVHAVKSYVIFPLSHAAFSSAVTLRQLMTVQCVESSISTANLNIQHYPRWDFITCISQHLLQMPVEMREWLKKVHNRSMRNDVRSDPTVLCRL